MKKILLLVFLLASCGSQIKAGTVIKSWMIPAHEEQRQGMCLYADKSGICYIHDYYWVHINDVCSVRLRADDKNATEENFVVNCSAVPAMGSWVHVQ